MKLRANSLPWHWGIESWCAEHFGQSRSDTEESAPFAPFEAHKPERFFDVPVVLLVLPSTTRAIHRGFAHAADLLRVATAGFRPVLVTDMFRTPALEVCDWPIEQILPEEVWLAHGRRSNWLEHAADHILAAQQYFGASYVLAPKTPDSARRTLRKLAQAYNAQESVLAQAEKILDSTVGDTTETYGFRHGWEQLTAGETNVREFCTSADVRVRAELNWGSGPGILLHVSGELPEDLLGAVHSAGWSRVELHNHPSGDIPFTAAVARACVDAFSETAFVVTSEAVAQQINFQSELCMEPNGRWRLSSQQFGTVRFDTARASEVFTEIQGLHHTLLR